jgi:hypothetical protein
MSSAVMESSSDVSCLSDQVIHQIPYGGQDRYKSAAKFWIVVRLFAVATSTFSCFVEVLLLL